MDEIQISKTYNIGFWWNSICYYLEVVCKPWHLVTFTSPSSEPHGWCLSSATFGRQPPSSWNCSSHLQYEYPFSAWHFWQPQDSYATTRQLIALGIWFYIISFKYKNKSIFNVSMLFFKNWSYLPLHCTDRGLSSTQAFPFQVYQSVQDCGQSPVHVWLYMNPVEVPLDPSVET